MGMGVAIKVTEEEKPPVIGALDWLKKNWPYLAIAGLGTALVVTVATRK